MKNIANEKARVQRLIDIALKHGAMSVSLWDGEEWPVKRAKTSLEVVEHMAATDLEIIRFRDGDGMRLGDFNIAWGEGNDNVYDHTDNEWSNRMWNLAGLGN